MTEGRMTIDAVAMFAHQLENQHRMGRIGVMSPVWHRTGRARLRGEIN